MNGCPSPDALRDLLDADPELDLRDSSTIRHHVRGCDSCLAALERLSNDPDFEAWLADIGPDGREAARDLVSRSRDRTAAEPPGTIGPFVIESEVGAGGMGVVYRARDRVIGRVVALKVLLPGLTDERSRGRFLQEVRASARVEHDHIVRVYGTSDPDDPRPYLVMEFIAGPSLADRIRDRGRLTPREAARIVAEVALGLAAAHSAGLVHRDVKPANVLIDAATGRAKIGDFGLARIASEDGGLTREGVVAGTPAYLSPEQALGTPGAGPLCDIYALGVTLYECLAGEPPFRGTPHQILRQILNHELRPPRFLNDAIPRDLETICLKAMAEEPHHRYASALDLANDLKRFLGGRPILARPLNPAVRLFRLVKRRPLASGLTTALALTLVAGSATTAVLWRRAEASAVLARARLSESDQNFRQARDAVDKVYVKLYVGDALKKPGLEAIRAEVLREILAYYKDFLSRRGHDPALRADVAETSFRVGLLATETGDRRDALAALRQALPLLESLARDRPDDRELRRKLAQCHDQIGYMLQQLGRPSEALEAQRRACDVYGELAAIEPNNPAWRQLMGHGFGNLANAYCVAGRQDEARRAYEQAREQQAELLRREPTNNSYRNDLAMTLNNMAVQGLSPDEAMRLLSEALSLRRQVAAEWSDRPYGRRNVARTLYNMALMEGARGRFAAGLELLDEACEILRQVNREMANHVVFRGELATALNHRAETLDRLGRHAESLTTIEESRRILDDLLHADPQNATTLDYQLHALSLAARAYERLGRLREALEIRHERANLLDRLVQLAPEQRDLSGMKAEEAKAIEGLMARLGDQARG